MCVNCDLDKVHHVFNTFSGRKDLRFGKFLMGWISFVFPEMMRNLIFDLENGGVDLYTRSTYTRLNTANVFSKRLVTQTASRNTTQNAFLTSSSWFCLASCSKYKVLNQLFVYNADNVGPFKQKLVLSSLYSLAEFIQGQQKFFIPH